MPKQNNNMAIGNSSEVIKKPDDNHTLPSKQPAFAPSSQPVIPKSKSHARKRKKKELKRIECQRESLLPKLNETSSELYWYRQKHLSGE
ncbi:hypothetical protein, partial [Acinetobacter baumannii]|uniref:hypothetical protein n=1 Tax=Acinetobacter baumannii TaxID=470 RepID=UPI0011786035